MLTIDPTSSVPLVEQIEGAIRAAIAIGEVRPGDELPPVRQLANDLAVNLNTVARAYRSLQLSGLVHSARGRGTHVTSAREVRAPSRPAAIARLSASLRIALADAKLGGLGHEEVMDVIDDRIPEFWPSHGATTEHP
jgi:GntR family transcriptional regulator